MPVLTLLLARYFGSFSFFLRLSVDDVPLVVAPLVEAAASLLSDWLPVEALVLLLSDWLPVVVVVSVVTAWLPVDVVLSMVRLERPRRSTVGETVEVEPVTDELTSELDPVIAELLVAAEPVTDGLEVAFAVDDGLLVPLPAAMPEAEPLMAACESGMQS